VCLFKDKTHFKHSKHQCPDIFLIVCGSRTSSTVTRYELLLQDVASWSVCLSVRHTSESYKQLLNCRGRQARLGPRHHCITCGFIWAPPGKNDGTMSPPLFQSICCRCY